MAPCCSELLDFVQRSEPLALRPSTFPKGEGFDGSRNLLHPAMVRAADPGLKDLRFGAIASFNLPQITRRSFRLV